MWFTTNSLMYAFQILAPGRIRFPRNPCFTMTRWKLSNWYQLSIQKWVQGIILTVWSLNIVISRLELFNRIIDDELCKFTTHLPYLYHLIIMVFASKIDIRVWHLRQRGNVDLGTLGAPNNWTSLLFWSLYCLVVFISLYCVALYFIVM